MTSDRIFSRNRLGTFGSCLIASIGIGYGGFRLLTRIEDSVPAQLDKERAYQKTKSRMPRRESDPLSDDEQRRLIRLPGIFLEPPLFDPSLFNPFISYDPFHKIAGLVGNDLLVDPRDPLFKGLRTTAFNPDILFGISQRAACTDLRDKIYGLLGIIEARDMPIDYTNSMFQVYKDMIQHIINPDLRYPVFAHRSVPHQFDFRTVAFSENIQCLLGGPFQNPLDFVGRARANGYHYSPIIKVGLVIDEQSALKSLITLFDYSAFDRIRRRTALRRGDVRAMAQKLENRWKDITKLKTRIQPIIPHMWSAKI
jgi:hypothetical protein